MTLIDKHAGGIHQPIVKSLVWRDEAQTQLFAAALATQPGVRDCSIELHGDLGAGKTTFVRHLLHALGFTGRVKSPTYAVVEPYELPAPDGAAHPLRVWHFDFYRFDDPREWEDAGFREIFAAPGLKVSEWPDKAAGQMPPADLVLRIAVQPDETRLVQLIAQSATGAAIVENIGA